MTKRTLLNPIRLRARSARTTAVLLSAFLSGISCDSCTLIERRVEFEEMGRVPEVAIGPERIVIRTSNSAVNSSLSIVRVEVDIEDSCVVVRGFQRIAFEYLDTFECAIDDLDVTRWELVSKRWYWKDADREMHEMSVRVESVESM